MKINFLKPIAIIAIFAGALASCANDDNYATPESNCVESGLTANKTVQQINTAATATVVQYVADDVIEAYVTSSDERGSFFKTVSFQTLPTDGSAPLGFSVSIDDTSLFGKQYYPGKKVFIKMKDLYFTKKNDGLLIGALYQGAVGRISQSEYAKFVVPSCTEVNEDELVRELTVTQAKSNANINTLIEIKDVQFKDDVVGKTYYDATSDLGGATNRILVDKFGKEVIFRTSSFANFSGDVIPANSGTVRGVMTKFGSDFQFVGRFETDIKLTQPRMTQQEPEEPGQPSPTAAFAFPGGNFENFTTFTTGVTSFGLKPYATQSAGTGRDASAALRIFTPAATANDYVFTTYAYSGLPANYSKIQFYVKGTSSKSLSLNVYKNDGTYYSFNLGDVSASKIISVSTSNQYTGAINTNGNWVLITLDLTGITDLNRTNFGGNFFALKVGSAQPYDLYLDNFTIE